MLGGEVVNTPSFVRCPACGVSVQAEIFPAFFRAPAGAAPPAEPLVSTEEAGCFFHPAKKAVTPCGRCGRFLCAVCDLELAPGRHLCPECLENGRATDLRRDLETSRVFYDKFALLLAGVPLLIPFFGWFMTIFTAPAALVLGIAAWSQPPRSLVRRSRLRLGLALLLALLVLLGWGALAYFFADAVMRKYLTALPVAPAPAG